MLYDPLAHRPDLFEAIVDPGNNQVGYLQPAPLFPDDLQGSKHSFEASTIISAVNIGTESFKVHDNLIGPLKQRPQGFFGDGGIGMKLHPQPLRPG